MSFRALLRWQRCLLRGEVIGSQCASAPEGAPVPACHAADSSSMQPQYQAAPVCKHLTVLNATKASWCGHNTKPAPTCKNNRQHQRLRGRLCLHVMLLKAPKAQICGHRYKAPLVACRIGRTGACERQDRGMTELPSHHELCMRLGALSNLKKTAGDIAILLGDSRDAR